jgi:hypothetical protein
VSDTDVRVAILGHFLHHFSAPTHHDIADALGISESEAESAFGRLADDHALVLAPGSPHIWMAHPFSAMPTGFTVRSGTHEWWGNCIWDSLGIVAMLGRDAEVITACPDCGEELVAEVRDGVVRHDDQVVHFSIPAARWWEDIGAT